MVGAWYLDTLLGHWQLYFSIMGESESASLRLLYNSEMDCRQWWGALSHEWWKIPSMVGKELMRWVFIACTMVEWAIVFFLFSGPSDWSGSWDWLPRLMRIYISCSLCERSGSSHAGESCSAGVRLSWVPHIYGLIRSLCLSVASSLITLPLSLLIHPVSSSSSSPGVSPALLNSTK